MVSMVSLSSGTIQLSLASLRGSVGRCGLGYLSGNRSLMVIVPVFSSFSVQIL